VTVNPEEVKRWEPFEAVEEQRATIGEMTRTLDIAYFESAKVAQSISGKVMTRTRQTADGLSTVLQNAETLLLMVNKLKNLVGQLKYLEAGHGRSETPAYGNDGFQSWLRSEFRTGAGAGRVGRRAAAVNQHVEFNAITDCA
jgi:hypothetical protein